MATGMFQNYYTGGIIGLIAFLILMFFILHMSKDNRIRKVLFLFFAWEYFMYANSLIRTPALSFLFIYLILYSNEVITSKNAAKATHPGISQPVWLSHR